MPSWRPPGRPPAALPVACERAALSSDACPAPLSAFPQLPSPPWDEELEFRKSLQLALRSAANGSVGAPDAAMATEDAEALPAALALGVVSPPAAGI